MKCIIGLVFLFTLLGCKKEDPTPELLDPIYSDLDKRAQDAAKSLEAEQKNQEDLKTSLEKAEPNSIELKDILKSLAKSRSLALDFDQQARYYKIRAQRRLLVDRIEYKKAFNANKPWPDPHEYSEYLTNIHLNEAPRNWSTRVPKLQDRLLNAQNTGAKGKTEGEKKE